MKDNIHGHVGKVATDECQIFLVVSALCPIEHIKNDLVKWCDQDAEAIDHHVALREVGDPSTGQQLLCASPAQIGRLSVNAAVLLQDFRPLVFGHSLELCA